MNFDLIIQILSIIAIIFSGLNFTFIGIAKVYWRLTFGTLKQRFEESESQRLQEKDLNSAFRHKHVHDVEGLSTIFEMNNIAIQKTLTRLDKTLDKLSDSITNLQKR